MIITMNLDKFPTHPLAMMSIPVAVSGTCMPIVPLRFTGRMRLLFGTFGSNYQDQQKHYVKHACSILPAQSPNN